MKNLLFILVLLVIAGLAVAADNPPLLCDTATLKAPTQPAKADTAAVCEPAPPVCPAPPPVATCPTPPAAGGGTLLIDATGSRGASYCDRVVTRPVTSVVHEVRTVPVKKRIWVDEVYMVNERQTQVINELRRRKAYRVEKYVAAKEVQEAIYKPVNHQGRAPRLSRRVTDKMTTYEARQKVEYEELVAVPVRQTIMVPTTRTRKVSTQIEELQTVTVPVRVTTMETKTVRSRVR